MIYCREKQDGISRTREKLAEANNCRNNAQALLAERKAFIKDFEVGDWVIRRRIKRHKFEPSHDGPFQIIAIKPKQNYTLRTISGMILKNNYHSDLLFPAFTVDGQPVNSPWFFSTRLLKSQRNVFADTAGLEAPKPIVS